jgi:hypothetical protein
MVGTNRELQIAHGPLHPLDCVGYYWRHVRSMRLILHVSQYFYDDRDTLSPQVWLRDCTALCSASQVTLEKEERGMAFLDRGDGTSFVATGSNLVRGGPSAWVVARRNRAQKHPAQPLPFFPAFQRYRN